MDRPFTRSEVRAAIRAGQDPRERRECQEADAALVKVPRPTYRDGVHQVLVDPALVDTLMEIAYTSLKLLDFTERGGAGAFAPREFSLMVTNLRNLETLLEAEKGAGPLVTDLLKMLDSFELD